VGELDGNRELTAHARVRSPKQAKALAEKLGAITGLPVTTGCRVPSVERMLGEG
jgi:hypothetical protein